MRITSLTASASTVGRLCEDIARKATAFRPDAILWVSNNTSDPQAIARAFADQCHASVGGISQHGLVGGGREYMTAASSMGDQHAVALALSLPSKGGGGALPFHSDCEGLPHLPASAWEEFVAAPPAQSPNLLMLASPPAEGHFAIEHWLSRLDTALPWARKVGGVTVGDSRLFVGETQHDGGAVGLALTGVEVDTLVCHGALPFGPSFEITAATGAMVRELDGRPVGEVIGPLLQEVAAAQGAAAAVGGSGGGRVVATAASDGNGATAPAAAAAASSLLENVGIMAGITVPDRPAVAAAGAGNGGNGAGLSSSSSAATPSSPSSSSPSVVLRAITHYSEPSSVLGVGVCPEVLCAPGARLQLHTFSAANAREELTASAEALARRSTSAGGLMVSCLGRGEALYGEPGVETRALSLAMRRPLALAGMFCGGQIAPVGSRTFFHTYTTTVAMLGARRGRGAAASAEASA